ncbi:RNA polymerase sigma factor [Bacillus sp. CGMCC 1.16607]|uniref:RNA polymerase sigma factor n=1 Tax=Bacillus sp. CGMCC 1.16607 TaxID=3351842 RepID=UPI003638168F
MSKIDITEVYSLYYRLIYKISFNITRDIHLAEDVVHETFIKAMNKAETLEDDGKVASWLSVIAARTAIDLVRKEKKKKWIPIEQEMLENLGEEISQDIESGMETDHLCNHLNCALRKLTYEYQAVLRLKLGKGLKEQEIADVLHLNPSTVKTRLYRARKQLKRLFIEQMSA